MPTIDDLLNAIYGSDDRPTAYALAGELGVPCWRVLELGRAAADLGLVSLRRGPVLRLTAAGAVRASRSLATGLSSPRR